MKRMTKQAATNRIHKLASIARLVKYSRAMSKIAEQCDVSSTGSDEGTSNQPELNKAVSKKLKKKKPVNSETPVSNSCK